MLIVENNVMYLYVFWLFWVLLLQVFVAQGNVKQEIQVVFIFIIYCYFFSFSCIDSSCIYGRQKFLFDDLFVVISFF